MALRSASPPPFIRRLRSAADFAMRRAHLIALALFAVVGSAVLDDYGASPDEPSQRSVGYVSLDYILRNADELAGYDGVADVLIYYGVAFELPAVIVERLLSLEDARAIHLSRRLMTHLLFLAGGFSAWLLAYRLFGNRAVASLAMLLFLLHPRIYAHSFFNTKDLPFLSVFMVSLYLIHRAFRRDSVWAFALCGTGAALLTNIRVMGAMLLPAVLGMLALDAFRAMKRGESGTKRALSNAGAFLAAFAAVLYAAWPLLWSDPLALADALRTLSAHPHLDPTLFRGEWILWPNIPWDYIPSWMLITTPPIALALAALGFLAVARLCAARWRDMFANSTARFGLLAVACLVLPAAAVVALNSNVYGDWRHMYFLYAPFCVLAAFGLRALASIPAPRLRVGALALAAVGIALAVVQMVSLHPYQSDYFNPLANKSGIAERWDMNYWALPAKEALEYLLETRPNERVSVFRRQHVQRNLELLPEDGRRRFDMARAFPDFRIMPDGDGDGAVWTRAVYGVPFVSILDSRAESEAAYRAAYARAQASEPLASAGGFDIYDDGDALLYIKEACEERDTLGTFNLTATPDPENENSRAWRIRFAFSFYGAAFDGKCLISAPLPDYPIAVIETGRRTPGGERLWSARIDARE